jgi:hypothetical protein
MKRAGAFNDHHGRRWSWRRDGARLRLSLSARHALPLPRASAPRRFSGRFTSGHVAADSPSFSKIKVLRDDD